MQRYMASGLGPLPVALREQYDAEGRFNLPRRAVLTYDSYVVSETVYHTPRAALLAGVPIPRKFVYFTSIWLVLFVRVLYMLVNLMCVYFYFLVPPVEPVGAVRFYPSGRLGLTLPISRLLVHLRYPARSITP